ncbi:MAG: enoyl-ACP reductase [Halobacteriovoraceae bacterium]|nr:enoyl-ACP reductase [Halobacteriovoraceae bacterium]|tara:strand:- start:8722 stop:9504 length:783 start_codon:yes stop_codon:yes gene_type:complete
MFDFREKNYLITGIANKKSVAFYVAKALKEQGAHLVLTGQTEEHLGSIKKLFPNEEAYKLDVESKEDLENLSKTIKAPKIDGLLHSIAFANFTTPNFLATPREDFLQATQISAFSFVELAHALRPKLSNNASLVSISISNTKATSYGYLGPIKAMLNSLAGYMAKSFSEYSQIRVNTIAAGPLKTSASAGIPDYLENYLFAEALTLRKEALKTDEVAKTALYLFSDLSSGLNGETITLDAGMNLNYFDQDVVRTYTKAKF